MKTLENFRSSQKQEKFSLERAVKLKKPTQEYEHRLAEKKEEVEREIVITGIKKLYGFLKDIEKREGSLPSVVLFMETSGRPLYYAVKPLLDKIYRDTNTSLPNVRFCKMFGKKHHGEDKLEYVNDWIKKTRDNLIKNKITRNKTIQEYKKLTGKQRRSESGEDLSKKIHNMTRGIKDLEDLLLKQEQQKEFLSAEKYKDILSNRIAQILSEQPRGAILAIDDISASGETLENVLETIRSLDQNRSCFAFTFIDNTSNYPRGQKEIDNFESGISKFPEDVARINERASKDMNLTQEQQILRESWEEIFYKGFSYRAYDKKAAQLGVKKDIFSESLYAEPAPERDLAAMRALRKRFRDIGKKTVEDMASKQTQ